MEIFLIRHTETLLAKDICYGFSDVLLKEPFEDKFKGILKFLGIKNAAIYSSPLQRCVQLANYFFVTKT